MIQAAIRIGQTYAIGRCNDDDLLRSEIDGVKTLDATLRVSTLLTKTKKNNPSTLDASWS